MTIIYAIRVHARERPDHPAVVANGATS